MHIKISIHPLQSQPCRQRASRFLRSQDTCSILLRLVFLRVTEQVAALNFQFKFAVISLAQGMHLVISPVEGTLRVTYGIIYHKEYANFAKNSLPRKGKRSG